MTAGTGQIERAIRKILLYLKRKDRAGCQNSTTRIGHLEQYNRDGTTMTVGTGHPTGSVGQSRQVFLRDQPGQRGQDG